MRAFGIYHVLAAASVLSTALAQDKLKIMPLGDSITEITCWRPLLWSSLADAGVTNSIEFVGSQTNNPQNCQGPTGWDLHHEGHSGYLAIDIAASWLVGWLQSTVPDIVVFMLGTNDVIGGHSTDEILTAFTTIVQEIRDSNPNTRIIVDLLIPLDPAAVGSNANNVAPLNDAIPAWAEGLSTAESPITIADTATGFTISELRDGIHPNAAGDAIIAAALSPVVLDTINAALGTSSDESSLKSVAGRKRF